MPEEKTLKRAQKDKRQGKSPSTQAGEFVREEFHHIGEGKHGAKSPNQAVAIGLSKARRAGVKVRPPARGKGKTSPKVRRQAERDDEKGEKGEKGERGQRRPGRRPPPLRARIIFGILRHDGRLGGSTAAIARQIRAAAATMSPAQRSAAARMALRPKSKSHSHSSTAGKKRRGPGGERG